MYDVVVPGITVNAFLEKALISSGKIDSVLLIMAFPKTGNTSMLTKGNLDAVNFEQLGASENISDWLNEAAFQTGFETLFASDGAAYSAAYDAALAVIDRDPEDDIPAVTGDDRAAFAKEMAAAAMTLAKYQLDFTVDSLRRISKDINVWVAYTFYDSELAGTTASQMGTLPGTLDEAVRVRAYERIVADIDLNQQIPLSVVLFPQERNSTAYEFGEGQTDGKYQAVIPAIHEIGWGFMSFLNGPFPSADAFLADPYQINPDAELEHTDALSTGVSKWLEARPEPQQGFAAMWHGFSYVDPPQDVHEAEQKLYLLTEQELAYNRENGLAYLENTPYESTLFSGNYLPLATQATGWFIRLNQVNNVGYYGPSGQGIQIDPLAPFSRVKYRKANEILEDKNFNYGWQTSSGYSLLGNRTLDTEIGWQWIPSRLAISVLRNRLVNAAAQVQFAPSDPKGKSVTLELRGLAAQTCEQMVAEGGLVDGINNAPPYRLIGPDVTPKGKLTMQVRVRPVGSADLINIDIINTVQP